MSTIARSPTYFTRIVPKSLEVLNFVAVASLALTAVYSPGAASESSGPNYAQDQRYLRSFVQGTPTTLLSPVAAPSGGSGRRSPTYGRIVAYPSVRGTPITLQTVVVGAPPNRQYDWPNPTLRKLIPQSHEDHSTIFDVTRPANEWVNPTLRTVSRQDFVRSSSLTLLATPAQAPFYRTDWPNPRGSTRVQDWTLRTPPQILSSIIPAGALKDWPNPRGYSRNEQLGWAQSGNALATPSVAYTLSPGGIAGGPDFRPDQNYVRATLLGSQISILTTAPVRPFVQTDWPNPRGVRNPQDWSQRTYQGILSSIVPFAQRDWPVPRGAKPEVQDWQWFNLPTSTSVQPPFRQIDWPNPRGQRSNPGWSDSFKLPLTTVRPPYLQTDWPVPKAARGVLQDFCPPVPLPIQTTVAVVYTLSTASEVGGPEYRPDQNYVRATRLGSQIALLVPPAVSGTPFFQTNWPVPRGARGVQDWISGVNLALETAYLSPATEISWPSFTLDRTSIWATALGSPRLLFTPVVSPATIRFDWPNPRGPKPLVQDWQVFNLPIATTAPVPFRQTNWPNPYGARSNPQWSDSFKLPLTTVRPPSIQRDWPVPKGHGPRQSLTQVALTIATFVPPPIPPAQRDWPNPIPYPPLKITYEFPASQNFWPPTPPIIPPEPPVLPRAKFIKASVSGPGGISQVSGPRAKTLVRGPKGRTDASDP